jgi:hypothetical protein
MWQDRMKDRWWSVSTRIGWSPVLSPLVVVSLDSACSVGTVSQCVKCI